MTFALFTYYRIIPFMIIVLTLFTASVGATYTQIGTINSDYITGQGIFDENLNPIITGSVNVLNQRYPPLVEDLDNDSINEVILLDGNTLTVYQNITLDPITSISLGNISSYVHMIIFDIDGDGLPNIIIASNSTFIQSFEFNGTHINKEMQLRLDNNIDPSNFKGNGEVVISCKATDECIAVYPESSEGLNGNALYVMGFDSSGNNGSALEIKSGNGASIYCFGREKNIPINTRSGEDYFVVSNAHWSTDNGEELFIYGLEILSNLTIIEHYQTEITQYDYIAGDPTINSNADCFSLPANPDLPQNSFTSVTSMEIQNAGDEELVIGYTTSLDTFRMATLDSNGNILSTFPFLQTAEGSIVSNIMRGEIFGNGKIQDFCMLGYDSTGNRIDLLCGSEQSGTPIGVSSEEFFFNLEGTAFVNITDTYNNHNTIIHSGEHKGTSVSEIITTFGIFEISYTTQILGGTLGINSDLILINQFSEQNTTVIPVDIEKSGNVDMLLLSPTNLFYLNDGFINTGGEIESVTYNPCVKGTVLKENTTLQVQLVISDLNGDTIRGGVTFYSGDTNEITFNQTTYVASGSTIAFSGKVNKSINSGILRLFSNDVENPNIINEQTQTFTVDTNGIEFGSQTCTEDFDITTSSTPLVNDTIRVNTLDKLASQIEDTSGVTKTQFWIFVMFLVAVFTIGGFTVKHKDGEHMNAGVVMAMVLLEQILLLFLGVLFGFLDFAFIVVTVIVGSVVIALWVTAMFVKDR